MSRWFVRLAFAILTASVTACTPPPPPATTAAEAHVEGMKAKQLFKEGAFLIDVRSPDEYREGHIEGADNTPVGGIDSREFAGKDTPIILYCSNGARAAKAAALLREKGYTRVYELGAMKNWDK
jgi:rhodanese-related sulfurtransferase